MRTRLGALLLAVCALTVPAAQADSIHFVIPAGAGGGLDGTARAVGNDLRELGLIDNASFENITGGGGARAMSNFIQNARRHQGSLLVNSTPMVIRTLQGMFPHSYHDLIPVAGVIANYGAFIVRADSPLQAWDDVVAALRDNPRAINVGGGSVRGSMDHVVLAMALEAAEIDPRAVRYVPYDGGGNAMLSLLGGEVGLLSTGLGESMNYIESGDVRVLAITAQDPHPDFPTLKALGYDMSFANWRGFFAAPGLPEAQVAMHRERFRTLVASEPWQRTLSRYGWTSLYLEGDDFVDYLAEQEAQLAAVMQNLGFLR
jgi:putative tricarboxylic transport membrane protein